MFYSHSLLARKEPLGQIWMAATMHAKMNRRKLNRLDLVRICEEILNPRAPMALRLSSILMGGVVIVYERKVKLLFDDVHRLLDELNEAWKKAKSKTDSTLLPKRRIQAKKEAITLPEHQDTDLDMEQSLDFSHHASLCHQQTGYFLMQLDSVDVGEPLNDNAAEGDQYQNLHQADPEDITLPERYDASHKYADLFNRGYERFEIDGDDLDFTSGEHAHIRLPFPNLIPSPPRQDQHQEGQRQPGNVFDEVQMQDVPENAQQTRRPIRRRKRKSLASIMDTDQTMIAAHVYQSWLQDTSDIVSRRRRNQKPKNILSTIKIGKLMEQPTSVIMGRLFKPGSGETYYPAPLLELFKEKPTHDLSSASTSPPLPREPSSWSSPGRQTYQDPPVEDFHSGGGSRSFVTPTEQLRGTVNNDVPPGLMDELQANLNRIRAADANLVTPRNSGDERRSLNSSSGKGVNKTSSEVNSGRSNRKRRHSSILSNDGLEPVSEDNGFCLADANLKLSRLSGNGPAPDQELLMETGPTQTQPPIIDQPLDQVTDAIRMELKSHFDIPGGPQVESLNNLTAGSNRRNAAMLFYQTCVLATRGFVKVKQDAPFEDILMTRGPNM